jgi:TP901 family phage tail tape measure protein
MADETISTRIVANADFSALIADVHKVTASLSKLQEQLANSNKMLANNVAVMNRNFSDTLRSTGQYSTHFVSLTSDVEKFGKNLDGGRLKLKDYFSTFQGHVKTSGGLIRDLARQQVAMQNAILQPLGRNAQGLQQFNVHIPRGLDEIKNKTAIAKQELQIMNRVIQDGAGQLINWGKNTQWAGRQLTVGLTLPIAAFGKAAADAFKVADQELVRLTKVYGDVAGTSAAELGRVRDEVIATSKELSAAFGTNFTETISLAADIAATGKTGNELLNSVRETSRLAVLGEVDRQEAMRATLAIQTAFKQNTDELSDSINFLNAVENQTSTTLQDLVEAIPKAGPVVKSLGGDIQDLALYLTAMREGGINASEAANALKSGLASLINPTKQSVGVMSDFGIDILGMVQKNAGNTTTLLFDLQAALDRLDPLSKAQAIEQLFGKFQFARISALLNNLGRQGSQTLQVLDLMKVSAADLEQVAGRELAAVTESASGKYRRAIESLKADLAGLGDQFLSIATTVINIVDKALKFFEGLPKPLKQAMTFLGALTALAGPLIMLTGVLANFFGYILKGVMHMKAFFKGGEGWKYLTPEMLAAEKAGKLVEQTFYSDAKAASVLQLALKNLIDEFSILEAKAKSGALAVNPAVSTMAGNLVMGAGPRVVDPNNPLAGAIGTRASTHMVPRSSLSAEQRMQQTIFGLVPGAIPVNRKIGNAPQIYMNEPLPPVPGVTTVGGVSTGVVAGEAAKWHSMMATLAMQSKAEIEQLKKQIATTGVVSKDFMNQFDDILPIVSGITDKAAQQSSLIVAELRAGKLTVEQARQQIIALNLEVERMIGQAVGTQAAAMGRTINPTIVPTLDQPVVDPTGKSNMRELFKKSKTRDLINKISRSLGVRTSGAGYNIETTRPRKFNSGGPVYMAGGGNIVPGPNINADVVPAMLTPGEFVVNREATAANLPLLMAINGKGSTGPNYNDGTSLPIGFMPASVTNQVLGAFGQRRSRNAQAAGTLAGRWGMIMPQTINDQLAQKLNSPGALGSDLIELLKNPDRLIDLDDFLAYNGVDPKEASIIKAQVAKDMASRISPSAYYADGGFGNIAMSSTEKIVRGLESRYPGISLRFQRDRMTPGRRDTLRRPRPGETQAQANARGGGSPTGINYIGQRSSNYGAGARMASRFGEGQVWGHFADQEFQKNTSMLSRAFGFARRTPNLMAIKNSGPMLGRAMSFRPGLFRNSGGIIGMNAGGMVPAADGNKYNMGGMVRGYNRGGIIAEAREKGFFGQGLLNKRPGGGMSPMAGMGLGMGMQMAGSMMQGPAGTALQYASLLPMIMPGSFTKVLTLIPKILSGFTSISKIVTLVRSGLVLLTRAIPGAAVIAGIYGLVKAFQAWRQSIEDTRRENIMLTGITEKGADEAKIKYVNLANSIKLANEQLRLAKERGLEAYAAYTSSGVPGLTLTIKQLRELKKSVKETMPETLATFNSIDSSKVVDLATNLKAQYVAGGMSVQDATNKIYALIEASNKAGMGLTAIASGGFTAIKDKATAAEATFKSFQKTFDEISNTDPKVFAAGLDSVIGSLDAAVTSLTGTKDSTGQTITEAKAVAMQFEKIAKLGMQNKKIGSEGLQILQKQRPELAAILNSGDDIASIYSKWKLLLAGVTLDLKNLTAEQAKSLALYNQALDLSGEAAGANTESSAALENSAKASAKLKKEIKDAQGVVKSAQKGDIGLSKERIRAIQDEIKEIRKRAEAKKKALQDSLNAENTELELQKLQLEYQQALARGDKDAAAQAQIQIQQLNKQFQTQKAIDKIEENARKEEEKRQAILDADARRKEDKKDAAGAAGETIESKQATLTQIDKISNTLVSLAKKQAMLNLQDQNDPDVKKASRALQGDFKSLLEELKKAPDAVQKAFAQYIDPETNEVRKGTRIPKRGFIGGADSQFTRLVNEISDTAVINYEKLVKTLGGGKTLADVIDAIKGKPGVTGISTAQITTALEKNQPKVSKFLTDPNSRFTSEGYLQEGVRTALLADKSLGLKTDNLYKIGSYTYRVAEDWKGDRTLVRQKAKGGPVLGSTPYLVGERGPELFVPSVSGNIIPSGALGASYNIPTNSINGVGKGANNSYNNNVYNINIELNGTNVSADDIMRRFKAELALINAKEGRVRTLGGNY